MVRMPSYPLLEEASTLVSTVETPTNMTSSASLLSPSAWGLDRYSDFTMDKGFVMLASSWPSLAAIIAVYLGLIFTLKPHRKSPTHNGSLVDIKTVRQTWNFMLAISSLLGSVHLITFCAYKLWVKGVYALICEPDPSFYQGPIGFWNLLYTLSKVVELGDTLLLLLSGRKPMFLHWFHHATVLPSVWYSLQAQMPYHSLCMTMNYFVHAVMYGYFALTDLTNDATFRLVWAKRITTLQCTQFVLMMAVFGVAFYDRLVNDNHAIPYTFLGLFFSLVASYLVLFLQFAEGKYGFCTQLRLRLLATAVPTRQSKDSNGNSEVVHTPWRRPGLSLEEQFNISTKMAAMLSSVATQDDLLMLYACYKQAKEGPIPDEVVQEKYVDFKTRAKRKAWSSIQNLSKEEAQQRYIQKMDTLSEKYKAAERELASKSKQTNRKNLSSNTATNDPFILYPVRIAGHGKYIPRRVVYNEEIEQRGGFSLSSQEQKRTGVSERRFADIDGGENLIQNGANAIRAACAKAGLNVEDLDLIVGGFGGHQFLPDDAALVQRELGLGESGTRAFTVHATCLSFLVAMEVAGSLMSEGRYQNVAVFASSIASVGLDKNEPHTAGLFGDGAAAVILQPSNNSGSAVHGVHVETYGCGADACRIQGGGSFRPKNHPQHQDRMEYFSMDGPLTVSLVSKYLRGALQRFMPGLERGLKDLSLAGKHVDIDWVVPHQASGVALDSLGMFGWPEDQILKTIQKYGNTIAASIPLTLCEGIDNGTIKRGDKVLLCGTSAGISIGKMLLTY